MDLVPEHRALLAVDVAGAGQKPGYERELVRRNLEKLVRTALQRAHIDPDDDVLEPPDWAGDGVLIVMPSPLVGRLLDATHILDDLVARYNRVNKPDLRLRVAVELGPVGEQPGLYDPKITINRMLNAKAFKDYFAERLNAGRESVHTGLIISTHVRRVAFSGDYTSLIRRDEFSRLEIQEKEYAETGWVRVHGYHARPLSVPPSESPVGSERVARDSTQITNYAAGEVRGVQAGTVHGGITFTQHP